MAIEKVTVLGAGTMGNGIAQVFAQHGYRVVLMDISDEQLTRAMGTIQKNLDRLIAKEVIRQETKAATLRNISLSTQLNEAVMNADLVIEAASENITVKFELFRNIDKHAPPSCILATNTSSLSITQIASVTSRPDKVIGMHFMNPVPIMKLVEVIRGFSTSDAVAEAVMAVARDLKKTPCMVNDYPGFVANRILMPMINEAIQCLQEGVAGVEEIDTVMKLGMSHPMGPLQLADFIGLDVCLAILKVLYDGFGQPKYAPNPVLVNMVMAGKLGVKSGEGFYNYANGQKQLVVSERFQS